LTCANGYILSAALPTTSPGATFTAGTAVCTAVGTAADLVPNTIAGCATYKAATTGQVIKTDSKCDACLSGYILSGALPTSAPGAVFATGSIVCTAAGTAADLVPPKIDNCDKYLGGQTGQVIKTTSVCQSCMTGFGLINNGAACIACSTGCRSCSNPGLAWCTNCIDKYYTSAAITGSGAAGAFATGLPASCTANTAANCATYSSNSNLCASCAAGFTADMASMSCVANAKPASPASALQVQATLVAAMLVLLALFQ